MGSLEMSLSKIGPNEIPLDSPWIRLEGARRTRDGPVGGIMKVLRQSERPGSLAVEFRRY